MPKKIHVMPLKDLLTTITIKEVKKSSDGPNPICHSTGHCSDPIPSGHCGGGGGHCG